MTAARYAIGIDLGTTNCALAYVELARRPAKAVALPIPQLRSLRTIIANPLLPSFFYYGTEAEIAEDVLDPLTGAANAAAPGYFIGEFARERAGALPGRGIHSAKSWLAHAGVDREAPILPFGSDEIPPELKLSPVEVSSAFLGYLKDAWDHAFARDDSANQFVAQRIVITVPASFDEGAQELTRAAARLAGYPPSLRLVEEPQAAFYAWLDAAPEGPRGLPAQRLQQALPQLVHQPARVLVCDVGGGTTDFSLFSIAALGAAQRPAIERVAASDHLLLGGDNIDLLIAHLLERLLKPDADTRLSRRQWSHLVPQACRLKEAVLAGASAAQTFTVAVPGEGESLFGGSLATTVARADIRDQVLDGFFPLTGADELPQARRSGLREIGLPYAADTAISRHLAAFLRGRQVDAVLFAGGTLRPQAVQARLLDLLEAWQGHRPAQLVLADMNLAIAEGAASFAALDADSPDRIRGGYPHSVYIELQRDAAEPTARLVCVLPRGLAEGIRLELPAPVFDLTVNRPVRFTAYTSNRRQDDAAGTLVVLDRRTFHPLPTLQTTMVVDGDGFNPRTSGKESIRVSIESGLTELGMLELALVQHETGKRWKLEFNLRKPLAPVPAAPAAAAAPGAGVGAERIAAANALIADHFGKKQAPEHDRQVKSLARDLEKLLNQERTRWNTPLLRALWPALYPGITRRGRSLAHENTWLYLAGFVLRPGYGSELDAWSVLQLWEAFDLGLAHRKEKSAQANWWMMWRRSAGGLPPEPQEALFAAAWPELRRGAAEFVEGTRLLGSLERVAPQRRLELCALLVDHVAKGDAAGHDHVFWALSRLFGRVPLYTSAETVLPPAAVEESFRRLVDLDWRKAGLAPLTAVFSAACRRTNLRSIDIDDAVRHRVLDKLLRSGATAEQLRVVREFSAVSTADYQQIFGEQLPAGLRLSVD